MKVAARNVLGGKQPLLHKNCRLICTYQAEKGVLKSYCDGRISSESAASHNSAGCTAKGRPKIPRTDKDALFLHPSKRPVIALRWDSASQRGKANNNSTTDDLAPITEMIIVQPGRNLAPEFFKGQLRR